MLDLPHQLQKRSHHAERNRSVAESKTAPHKGKQIAKTKSRTNCKTGYSGKAGTAQHLMFKFVLFKVQMFCYPVFAFKRTQNSIEFDAFLHLHLDLAFALTDGERHFPQSARNQLANHDHHRCNQ